MLVLLQGHVEAQAFLGDNFHEIGNMEKATYWWAKAAEQGNESSQNNLGACYMDGDGVSKDIKKAVYWFTKAIEQGNEEARVNLENLRRQGIGW